MSGQKQENGGRRAREASDIGSMLDRMMKALVRRAAEGDMDALVELVKVEAAAEEWAKTAAIALRCQPIPYSWFDIGNALGVSRQAAQQRFAG